MCPADALPPVKLVIVVIRMMLDLVGLYLGNLWLGVAGRLGGKEEENQPDHLQQVKSIKKLNQEQKNHRR